MCCFPNEVVGILVVEVIGIVVVEVVEAYHARSA
jgi:hypothetical protein